MIQLHSNTNCTVYLSVLICRPQNSTMDNKYQVKVHTNLLSEWMQRAEACISQVLNLTKLELECGVKGLAMGLATL